jgi:hypothetical protein
MRIQHSNMFDNDMMKLEQTLPIINRVLRGYNVVTFLLSSMLSIILRARVKSPKRQ